MSISGRHPLEEIAEHPRRRAPDQVLVDDVGVGLEEDPAADQAPALVAGQQRADVQLEDRVDLARGGTQAVGRSIQPTIG